MFSHAQILVGSCMRAVLRSFPGGGNGRFPGNLYWGEFPGTIPLFKQWTGKAQCELLLKYLWRPGQFGKRAHATHHPVQGYSIRSEVLYNVIFIKVV